MYDELIKRLRIAAQWADEGGMSMGVYIKGMEMPTRCVDCWLMDGDGCLCSASCGRYLSKEYRYGKKDKPEWCPLVSAQPTHDDGSNALDALDCVDRPTGKWIELPPTEAWEYVCDQCGRRSDFKDNYCPNCGARMEPENDIVEN